MNNLSLPRASDLRKQANAVCMLRILGELNLPTLLVQAAQAGRYTFKVNVTMLALDEIEYLVEELEGNGYNVETLLPTNDEDRPGADAYLDVSW